MINYDNTEGLLTVTEVAELIHVHPNTLRRWANEGKIMAYRITQRGDRRFKPSDVAKFINEFYPCLAKVCKSGKFSIGCTG